VYIEVYCNYFKLLYRCLANTTSKFIPTQYSLNVLTKKTFVKLWLPIQDRFDRGFWSWQIEYSF